MAYGVLGYGGSAGSAPFRQQAFTQAVSYDNIPYYHYIEFCKPIPNSQFDTNNPPPRTSCGTFTRELNNYPRNVATITNGNYMTFGESEMVLTYLYIENYPREGGTIHINFWNPDGTKMFDMPLDLPKPNPEWVSWWAWCWAVVGHFDKNSGYSGDEIIKAGSYESSIQTPWGSAIIDFEVTSTLMPVVWECVGPGMFSVYKNNQLQGVATPGYPVTASFQINDNVSYTAIADTGAQLVNVCDVPYTECRADSGYSATVIGKLPQKMVATFQEQVGNKWSCSDNCSAPHTTGEYDSQVLCQVGCAAPPPPGALQLMVSSNKINIGESVTFTTEGFLGETVTLYEKELLGNKFLDENNTGTFIVTPAGTHTYVARHYSALGVSTWSNEVYVEVVGGIPEGDWTTLAILGGGALLAGLLLGRR